VTVRPNRRWIPWVTALAAATLLTILGTSQQYAALILEGLPTNLPRMIRERALDMYAWALVAPVVFHMGPPIEARWPGRPARTAAWTGIVLLLTVVHTLIEITAARAIGHVSTRMAYGTMFSARWSETLAANLLVAVLAVLAFYAGRYYHESRERDLRESRLAAQLAGAELDVLRMRLQPHFLFNTLHTVSALMQEDVEAARRVLTLLSDLLRLSLDRAESNEVALSDELTFLESYLEIQRARFRDRLTVRFGVPEVVESALVPSLLLQPLIENAIRHGIEPRGTGGVIVVQAAKEGSSLALEVCDDGPGLSTGTPQREGLGLSNTRARLEALYPGQHAFALENVPGGGLRVRIRIPFRQ